ncbi:hypothetical protein [Lactiplantibacillus fabifermentans]|uniref:Uncharacterized protein n=1 Tax=Lactiplantibacillus fabifermentans DSM 21115 TaxID=1413187 RepID=A0A0R2NMK6_9LACO|nr:hypothetical protein [Lactiplantibacillus fabifermentans]KRO26588.1 hypothetical protein DY78_GL000806 [Lactiplantibacillus fabifermentans DSM 21115]
MRAIIKYKHRFKTKLSWEKLAMAMWQLGEDEPVAVNHTGDDQELNDQFTIALGLRYWGYDKKWHDLPIKRIGEMITVQPFKKKKRILISTPYRDELMITSRAFYVLVSEIATALDGEISQEASCDDKIGTEWITPDSFDEKYKRVVDLSRQDVKQVSFLESIALPTIDEKRTKGV